MSEIEKLIFRLDVMRLAFQIYSNQDKDTTRETGLEIYNKLLEVLEEE